ncbi:unnamed protein product [Gongylonema pulchrum]|uniref:Uncharacterized protein n=1 Tax=Gongylonema pulchrum TaxID=637853 RepID=A0A183EGL0_9BILA|nr:unnamed protein product [Gongylonema pulchrum]
MLGRSPLGLRVTDYEEQIGADVVQHGLAGTNIARYHIEKPLSSKTFATVTKAITKWKIQTRANRALRQQQAASGARKTVDAFVSAVSHMPQQTAKKASQKLTPSVTPLTRSDNITAQAIHSMSLNLPHAVGLASDFKREQELSKCVQIDETTSTAGQVC